MVYPHKERQSTTVVERLTKLFNSSLRRLTGAAFHHGFTSKTAEAMRTECMRIYLREHHNNIIEYASCTDDGIDRAVDDIMGIFKALKTQWLYDGQRKCAVAWPINSLTEVSSLSLMYCIIMFIRPEVSLSAYGEVKNGYF